MTIFITKLSTQRTSSIYDEYGVDVGGMVNPPISFISNAHHAVNSVHIRQFQQWKDVHEVYHYQGVFGQGGKWVSTLYTDKIYLIKGDRLKTQTGYYYVPPGVFALDIILKGDGCNMSFVPMQEDDGTDSSATSWELRLLNPQLFDTIATGDFDSINVDSVVPKIISFTNLRVSPLSYLKYTIPSGIKKSITIKQIEFNENDLEEPS